MEILTRDIKIVRVNNDNYNKFIKLIESRRTRGKQGDLSYYDNQSFKKFMNKYQVINSNTFFIYAAQFKDEFVGYINAVLIPKPDPRLGIIFIDELWVPGVYRKNGIATLLMKEVFKLAKELKLWRLRLYVGSDNIIARNFYKNVGYTETGEDRCCEINVKDIMVY